ncbi:hypothetical protein NXS19_012720 [Fusarium pseudograminearum]|nr:hypothetical protein NXS19_012720 [Fusarium pseudograminearum]
MAPGDTTTIYRANLPLDGMMQWAEGKACRPVFPLQISVKADALQENEAQNLVRLTQHALDDHNDFSGHHLRLQLAPKGGASPSPAVDDESHVALTIQLAPGESNSASLDSDSAILNIAYPSNAVPSASSSSSALATYIANELQSTFREEQSIISYLLSTSSALDAKPQGLTPRLSICSPSEPRDPSDTRLPTILLSRSLLLALHPARGISKMRSRNI